MKKTLFVGLIMILFSTQGFALDQPSVNDAVKAKTGSDAKAYYERGLKAANYENAVREFTKAIELEPGYAEAYLARGDAYAGKEKAEEAAKDYSKYLELKPKDTFAYLKRAAAYSYSGNCNKAIEDLNKVIKEFPGEANLYFSRGTCYELLNKKEQAVEDYKTAAELGYGPAQETLKEMEVK